MKKRFAFIFSMRWAALVVLIGLLAACNGTPSYNWPQFHGDGPNQGFVMFDTPQSFKTHKWSEDLGGLISYSSQACDGDGNVYICLDTFVIKISPTGSILWKKDFQPAFVSTTPAVGPTGRVYAIANTRLGEENFQTELHCLDSNGNLLWSRIFGGVGGLPVPTIASPKIWEKEKQAVIFTYRSGVLYAFSEDGRMPANISGTHHCSVITNSSWFWDIFKSIWNTIKDIFKGRGSMSMNISALSWYEGLEWPSPTPAVVDYKGSPFETKPLVVVADECGMAGIQWDPGQERFSLVWKYNHGDASLLATPLVTASGTLVTVKKNDQKGTVQFFDIFHDINTPSLVSEYTIQEEYPGTPAAAWLGSYFYIASRYKLYRFDSIGNLVASVQLKGQTFASPSCSMNVIYVSTTDGLETFDIELSQHYAYAITPYGAGINSPTISKDKTIYLCDKFGYLYAF